VSSKPNKQRRRDFLKGVTFGTIGLACTPQLARAGRLGLMADPQYTDQSGLIKGGSSDSSPSGVQNESRIFIGAQYYRPPNPRREDWDRDLHRAKETGLEVIRVWMYWATVHPDSETWYWKDYDLLFDAAERNRVRVLLQYMPEAAPYWFAEQYPDTRYVDKDGRPVELSAMPALQIGGYPGVCVDHPQAHDALEEFLYLVSKRYGQRSGLFAYDAWNEIWLPECFCAATEARFQGWLRDKWCDIQTLNRKYGRSYGNFKEIWIPKAGVFGDMMDYWEFLQWVKQERLRWLVETIGSADPNHIVVCHTGYPLLWDSDAWSLANSVGKWGTSCYVGDEHPSLTPVDIHDIALELNATRDSSQGKPWWVAEMTAGRVWGGLGHGQRSDEEVRLKMILGLSFGAEGLIFWQWRPEIYGQESPNFGLTGLDGELNSRTETVRQISGMLTEYREVFDSLQWSPPSVGLIWDPRGAMFEHEMDSEKRTGWDNFEGFYRALIDEGFSVEILNSRLLADSGIPHEIRVLFAPFLMFDRPGLATKLEAWVGKGGTLLGGPRMLLYDSETYANKSVPPPELVEVFGVKMKDTFYPASPVVQTKSNDALKGLPDRLVGQLLVETYQLHGSEVLGTWEGEPTLTIKNFGNGRGIMCGTFLGVNYSPQQTPQMARVVAAICESSGLLPDAKSTGGALVRVARSGNDQVIFLMNPFDDHREASVTLCEAPRGPVIDVLSGLDVGRVEAGKPFSVQLKAKDAKILLCRGV